MRDIQHTIILNYDNKEKRRWREDFEYYSKRDDVYIIYRTFRNNYGGQIKFCYKK